MSDIETALRDALSARAAAVTPDPDAYAAVLRRRDRRPAARLRGALVVAGAGATVAAVVAALAVVTADPPRPAPPAATAVAPAPRTVVAVMGGSAFFLDSDRPQDGGAGANPASATVTSVAAVGDDRMYYSAASPRQGCTSVLTRLGYDAPHLTITSSEPVGPYRVPGRITDMAVSRDGARLAYVAATGAGCDVAELRVRDLRTGRERVWRGGADPGPNLVLQSLSWSPDGRRLAYTAGLCCTGVAGFRVLDPAAPGADYLAPASRGEAAGTPDADYACFLVAPGYRGATGELAAVRVCVDQTGRRPGTSGVVRVDPGTGAVLGDLFALPGDDPDARLAFDASGDHAFVERGTGGTYALYRWTRGGPPQLVHLTDQQPRHLVW
jgi:hypothetical protein